MSSSWTRRCTPTICPSPILHSDCFCFPTLMSTVVTISDLMGLQLQRHLQDCGEDAEQRRVQELLGHGRRLLRSERVGAEPPRDGFIQPVRGRSRDAVAGDPCSCGPLRDDLGTHWDDDYYSQTSSWQRRLMMMSGAETTSNCKSKCLFILLCNFCYRAFICSFAVIAQFCVPNWNRA